MRTTESDLLDLIQRKRKREEVEDKKKLREEIEAHCEDFFSRGGSVKEVGNLMVSANSAPHKDDYKRGREILAQKRAKEQARKNGTPQQPAEPEGE